MNEDEEEVFAAEQLMESMIFLLMKSTVPALQLEHNNQTTIN